jgi:hypothetical protein
MNTKRMNYEDVDSRLHRFWELFPDGRVETLLTFHDAERIVFEARLWRYSDSETAPPAATGFAEEFRLGKKINETWGLENAETSALGRALANLGLSGKGARPSTLEMTKLERQEEAGLRVVPNPPTSKPSDVAKAILAGKPLIGTDGLRAAMNDLNEDDRGKLRGRLEGAGLATKVPPTLPSDQFDQYQAILAEVTS